MLKYAAIGAIALSVLGGAFAAVFSLGAKQERTAFELASAEAQLEQEQRQAAAAADDNLLRAAQTQQLADFEIEVTRLYDVLENTATACFVGPDADWLRELWRQ